MVKVYAYRVYPNATQIHQINNTLGCCRIVYNKFLEENFKTFKETDKGYITAYDFSKAWLTPVKKSEEYSWLSEVSSKALKDSLDIADKGYRKFLKHPKKVGRPRFKSKKDPVTSYYFVKDGVRFREGHIWVPVLRWIRTTQENYIPECGEITGGRLVKKNDKYYVHLKVRLPDGYRTKDAKKFRKKFMKEEYPDQEYAKSGTGLGIDLGIKNYATIFAYNKRTEDYEVIEVPTFLKDPKVIDLENKIKNYQRIISAKTEINKSKNLKKGVCYNSSRIQKLRKKISKCFEKLRNIKIDYINKLCYSLAITNPDYIAIEDLSVVRMLQKGHRKLADKIQKSIFDEFHSRLETKCKEFDVQLRIVDKFYPSSKMCCGCGSIKEDLKLKDRVYVCDNGKCGNIMDRDLNAAINIYNCKAYEIID